MRLLEITRSKEKLEIEVEYINKILCKTVFHLLLGFIVFVFALVWRIEIACISLVNKSFLVLVGTHFHT